MHDIEIDYLFITGPIKVLKFSNSAGVMLGAESFVGVLLLLQNCASSLPFISLIHNLHERHFLLLVILLESQRIHVIEKLQLLYLDLGEENSPVNADSLGIGKPPLAAVAGGGQEDGKEEDEGGRTRPHGLAAAEWPGEAALRLIILLSAHQQRPGCTSSSYRIHF